MYSRAIFINLLRLAGVAASSASSEQQRAYSSKSFLICDGISVLPQSLCRGNLFVPVLFHWKCSHKMDEHAREFATGHNYSAAVKMSLLLQLRRLVIPLRQ